jgi:hypothetical protein
MKTLVKTVGGFLLAAGLVAFFTPAVLAQDQNGTVSFTASGKGIVIHPGTKITKEDEQAMTDALKKYDKRLYLIEEYKDGKLIKTMGELKNGPGKEDIYIDAKTSSEVASAKAAGITDWTWIFNVGPNDQGMPLNNLAKGKEMNQQLLKDLTPILQKYGQR